MNISTTSQNAIIEKLAQILQESRIILAEENTASVLSDEITRKIISLCVAHLILDSAKKTNEKKSSISVKDFNGILEGSAFFYKAYNLPEKTKELRIASAYDHLNSLLNVDNWQELIYFAFETFEYSPSTFLGAQKRHGSRLASSIKKKNGIYYTPYDVIDYMIQKCNNTSEQANSIHNKTYLDCSCGTGVFLLKVINNYKTQFSCFNEMLSFIDSSIWGVDKSDIAVENCRLLMYIHICQQYQLTYNQKNSLWDSICNSIICGDSTKLDIILKEYKWFPKRYSCIIGNPPYVSSGEYGNLFVPFVRNMMNYTDNCSALILPLSIMYSSNKHIIELRQDIINSNYTWEFINFDRSPDSLFGDQVKTRNTIVFCKHSNNGTHTINTTGLMRWSSQNRNTLFSNICTTKISKYSNSYFPKISNELENEAFEKIMYSKHPIKNMLGSNPNIFENTVYINGTSYNWICAYDDIPPSIDENNELYIPSSMINIQTLSETDKYFLIAIICNRITYWLWTVTSDAFHVNCSFLKSIGFNKSLFNEQQYTSLVELGIKYCTTVKCSPTISYNCKKKIVNYNHLTALDIIKKIETIICDAYTIPDFIGYIERWYDSQVSCGRKNLNKENA